MRYQFVIAFSCSTFRSDIIEFQSLLSAPPSNAQTFLLGSKSESEAQLLTPSSFPSSSSQKVSSSMSQTCSSQTFRPCTKTVPNTPLSPLTPSQCVTHFSPLYCDMLTSCLREKPEERPRYDIFSFFLNAISFVFVIRSFYNQNENEMCFFANFGIALSPTLWVQCVSFFLSFFFALVSCVTNLWREFTKNPVSASRLEEPHSFPGSTLDY